MKRALKVGHGLVLGVVCGLGVTACGSSSSPTQPEHEGGSEAGGSEKAGLVGFTAGSAGDYTIVGTFIEGSGMLAGSSPCLSPVNGCTFCGPSVGGTSGGNLHFSSVQAGTVTVKDGSKTLGTLTPSAAQDNIYNDNSSSLRWAPGDTLSVAASGSSDVPAFTGQVTAPSDIAGVTPALSLLTTVTQSLSQPFVVTWTPSSDGATMKLVVGGGVGETIGCTADDTAGKIEVPTSLLSMLTSKSGTAGLTRTVSKSISDSGFTITIQASPLAVDGSVSFTP